MRKAIGVSFDNPKAAEQVSANQLKQTKDSLDNCNAYVVITVGDNDTKAYSCLGTQKAQNTIHMTESMFQWMGMLGRDCKPLMQYAVTRGLIKLKKEWSK